MKSALTFMIMICSISSFSQNSSISGTIENPIKETVYVRYWNKFERKLVILDSAKVENGQYKLSFELDSIRSMQFYDGNEFSTVIMKPGEHLGLSVNTAYFDETISYSGDGADRHNLLKSMYLIQESEMTWVYSNYEMEDAKDTVDFFANVDTLQMNYEKYIKEQVSKHSDVEAEITAVMEGHFVSMNRTVGMIRKNIRLKAIEVSSLGKPFYNMTGVDLKDKKAELKDHYGKPIVIDFWATWCGPCKYQFPFLHDLEEEYGDRFTFLSVAVWCKKDDWKKMAEDYGFKNNIYLEEEESNILRDKYILTSIPRYVLLDEKGNIVDINSARPTTGLKDQLEEFLAKK